MLAISVVNLILSIFGITVSSIFILFWCGRYFCSRVIFTQRSRGFMFSNTGPGNRRVVEHTSSGVSPLIIEHFPITVFRQDMFLPRQDAVCAVCLGEYKEGELLRFLPQCAHNFHRACIDAWLQQHATCPVCRMSLQGYFVGRMMAPLQLSPAPTEHGSWTPSLQSDAGSLGSFPSRGMAIAEDSTSGCDEAQALASVVPAASECLGGARTASASSSQLTSGCPSQGDMDLVLLERPGEPCSQSSVVVLEGLGPCGIIDQGCIEHQPTLPAVLDSPNPRDIHHALVERPADFRAVDVGIAHDLGTACFVERG